MLINATYVVSLNAKLFNPFNEMNICNLTYILRKYDISICSLVSAM